MKHSTIRNLILTCLVTTLFSVSSANATVLLAVDFGGDTTQAGFISQGSNTTTYNLGGGLSIAVVAGFNPGISDRNNLTPISSSGSAVIADGTDIQPLLDDFLISLFRQAMTITITGGGTGTFVFEGWFYDALLSNTATVQNIFVFDGTGPSSLVATPNAGAKSSSPTSFAVTGNGTSPIIITVQGATGLSNGAKQTRFNGFVISGPAAFSTIPEPSTITLLAFSLIGASFARKRRTQRIADRKD